MSDENDESDEEVVIKFSRDDARRFRWFQKRIIRSAKEAGVSPVRMLHNISVLICKAGFPLNTPGGGGMSDEEADRYMQDTKAKIRKRSGQEDFSRVQFAGFNRAVFIDAMHEYHEQLKKQIAEAPKKARPDKKTKVKTRIKNKKKKSLKKKRES